MKIIFIYLVLSAQAVIASPLQCVQKAFVDQKNELNLDQLVLLFSEAGPDCSIQTDCYKKAEKAFKTCDAKRPNDLRAYLCSGTTNTDKTIECFQNASSMNVSFNCSQRAMLCHKAHNMAPLRCVKDTLADKVITAITNENIAILCTGAN